jgi:hypothetical protein
MGAPFFGALTSLVCFASPLERLRLLCHGHVRLFVWSEFACLDHVRAYGSVCMGELNIALQLARLFCHLMNLACHPIVQIWELSHFFG